MKLARAIYCMLVVLMMAKMTKAQDRANKPVLSKDSTKIETKYIKIDFGTTGKLKKVQNAVQTKQGISISDTTQQAVLLFDEIEIPIDKAEPFLAVGSRWFMGQDNYDLTNIRIEIRSSADRQQWSEWKTIQKDEHLTTGRDTLVGQLKYLPDATRFVQFRLSLSESDNTGDKLLLRSLQLSFTSPGATPSDRLKKLKQQSKAREKRWQQEEKAMKPYPMPEYVSRTEWDCPDGQEPSGPVSRTDVTHQIIHHSAGPNSADDWPAVVRSIWDYHVNTNGWSDIGYNWLVDPNGIIYQGRGWIDGDDEVQGAHFCGTNSNTMGACLMGNFEEISPEPAAMEAVESLLAWKSDQKNIDPLATSYHSSSGLDLHTISGHRDGCSTLCPGENLYVQLPKIRNNVKQKIGETAIAEKDIEAIGNYPNPFSESTTITFTLKEAGTVRLTIWDITGKLVQEVSRKFYDSGTHTEIWNASNYASGIYFFQIEFEDQYAVQKMALVH